MSDEPSGAIDQDFDESERPARDQITDALADLNTAIESGDVAIDLVYHRPVYVRRKAADSCVDYWESGKDFDLVTYKAHPYLPVGVEDTVFECVYLPTKPGDVTHDDSKGRTYDFPAGRLMRVPVELLWGGDVRPQENLRRACVAAMLATADGIDREDVDLVEAVHAVARATFGDDAAFDAAERAGIPIRSEGDDAELGDFDGGE